MVGTFADPPLNPLQGGDFKKVVPSSEGSAKRGVGAQYTATREAVIKRSAVSLSSAGALS